MQLKVAIYARISQDAAGLGLGVERQVQDCCARVAAEPAWSVVGAPYVDNDISATKGRPRPQYLALMAAVERGEIDVIVVWQQSRLWRNRRERADAIEVLQRAEVRIVAIKGAELDLSTATGRMVAGVIGEMDAFESEVKGERVKRAMQQRAEMGLPNGGTRRFGFTAKGQETIPEEAELIRECARRVLEGESLSAVARWLESTGAKPPVAEHWERSSVRHFLLRPAMIGRRYHKGVDVAPAHHGAILDEVTWYAVREKLLANKRNSQSNTAKYLLAGIARCGDCGAKMWSSSLQRNGKKYLYYACLPKASGGCRKVFRALHKTDDHVEKWFLGYLAREDVRRHLISADVPDAASIAQVERDIKAVETRMIEVAEEFGSVTDDIGRRQFRVANAKLREQYDSLLRQRTRYADVSVFGGLVGVTDIKAYWESLLLPKKRELIRAALAITIYPAGRSPVWDPTLIRVEPRRVLVG